jgi:hypothetical protein
MRFAKSFRRWTRSNLTTARIMIEDGAYFKGSIEIDRSAEKESGGESFSQPVAAGVGSKDHLSFDQRIV